MMTEKNFIYAILSFAIFFHFIAINFYSINFEFIFFEASNFIKEGFKKEIAEQFFKGQANTFFFSFVISFFSLIFPFFEPIHIGKIISLSSFIFIVYAGFNLYEKKVSNNKSNFYYIGFFIFFLTLNPLIWVFSYRSTPDVISMALGFYAFSIIYRYPKNNKYLYIAALILGFATTLKIIVGIYLIAGIMLVNFIYIKNNFLSCLIIGILYSIIPLIYFSITYYNFNFFLFSAYYKSVLSVHTSLSDYFNNLILYLSFLFIFSSPIIIGNIIFNFKNYFIKRKLLSILVYLIVYYIGSINLVSSVEMNFGFFSQYLNSNILNGILYCSAYTLVLLIYQEARRNYLLKNFLKFKLFLVVIAYLLIISSSLASQRYLIVILPLVYFLFMPFIKNNLKFNIFFMLIICVPINILLVTNHYLTASVSKKMIEYIKENDLLDKVCAGAIGAHAQHEFSKEIRDTVTCSLRSIHIQKGTGENETGIIHAVSSRKIFFLKKELRLKVIR